MDRWRKRSEKEVCVGISLFPIVVIIFYFSSECLLDLSSMVQEVTWHGKWSQVVYCVCLNNSPSSFILHVCWLFNICQIEIRFKNWLLDLDKLRTWVGNQWHGEPDILVCLCGWSPRTTAWGDADCILGGEIMRLSWFNSCKELMWTDLDVKDNDLGSSSRSYLSLEVYGGHRWQHLPNGQTMCVWQCWCLQLGRVGRGPEGWSCPTAGVSALPHSWMCQCQELTEGWVSQVCSASGTCVRQRCLLVSTCLPG